MSEHIARARAVIAKALREIWEADDVTWNPEAGDIVRALDAAGLLVTPEREAAAYVRELRADADGAEACGVKVIPVSWLRERADRIEQEAS